MRTRLYYLDNLRYLAVWCVVAFHAAVGYAGLPEFFIETNTSSDLLIIRRAVALFTLPLLFLLAGYFTLPSLQHQGTARFLKHRILRLGLPFLAGIVLLGPLMPYLGYYEQSFKGLATDSYWEFWTHYIGSGFSHWTLPIVFTTHPQFHHQHFYFLAFLMEILLIFVLVHAAWKRWWPHKQSETHTDTRPRFTAAFMVLALSIPTLHLLFSKLPGSAEIVAFFFFVSVGDLFLFGGAFALGVFAWHRQWFVEGRLPDWRALGVLAIAFVIFHQGGNLLQAHRHDLPSALLGFEQGVTQSLATWLIVAFVLVIAARLLNRSSTFDSEMAASSYDIYILQYPVILALRFPLVTWEAPALLKYALVVPSTVLICWALSRYLIRPRPRIALSTLLVMSLALSMFGLPRWGDSHLLLDRRAALMQVVPAPEDGTRVNISRPASMAPLSDARPAASVAWQNGTLFLGHNLGGLFPKNDQGMQQTLVDDLAIGDVAATHVGQLVVIARNRRQILSLNPQTGKRQILVDSDDFSGTPLHLAVAPDGGVYFSTANEDAGGAVYFLPPKGPLETIDVSHEISSPRGLALGSNGRVLYLDDADGVGLWSVEVLPDGSHGEAQRFAELFRADRRYGEPREGPVPSTAEGITVSGDGHIYVATSLGVQLFTPEGRLLGLISFPQLLPESYRPPRPLTVAFGGTGHNTLFVSCGELVFSFETLSLGAVQEPSGFQD